MSRNYGITPEEMLLRKKRNRYILYVSIFALTIIVSAVVTYLANAL